MSKFDRQNYWHSNFKVKCIVLMNNLLTKGIPLKISYIQFLDLSCCSMVLVAVIKPSYCCQATRAHHPQLHPMIQRPMLHPSVHPPQSQGHHPHQIQVHHPSQASCESPRRSTSVPE